MKKIIFLLATTAFLLTGCQSSSELVGGNRSKHGCIGSAGYTWSEVRKDCIRIFEEGICLHAPNRQLHTGTAFIVFSTDKNKAEVFLPKRRKNMILERCQQNKWSNKKWILIQDSNKWILKNKDKAVFIKSEP